ncbi:MAG: hypothetical protein WDZ77_02060 [Candidatus Pacearchaeota archaeon]
MTSKNLRYGTSKDKRILILLEFTKELLKNSGEEVFELEEFNKEGFKKHKKIKDPFKFLERKDKQILKPKKEEKEESKKADKKQHNDLHNKILKRFGAMKKGNVNFLNIPKPKLPERFNYLKPSPSNMEIDLGILNPFLKDPLVKNIECNGPGENIMVIGTMGRKKTNIFLNEAQVEEVVNRFSKLTKIPSHEGVFRVVAGKFIFSAVISPKIGSKFLIKKMFYDPRFRR